jgi:dihydroorotase
VYDLLIQDATIIHAGRRQVADIAVSDGTIVYIGDRPSVKSRRSISAIGRFVMPGAIDLGVSLRGGTPEDWGSLSRAAAAAGVTTLIATSGAMDADSLAEQQAASASALVSHGHWGHATPANAEDLAELWVEGRICGAALDNLSEPLLSAHLGTAIGLLGVHADGAADVERLQSLVRTHQRATHIFGVSSANEVEVLDAVRGELPLSCAISPNHLFLSVETMGRIPAALRCRPPIRPELDRRAMWTAIKRRRIDCFSSGHVPHPKTPVGQVAAAGLPGVDTLLRLLMSAVFNGRMSLEVMVEMCSSAPARILGLERKGSLEVGADADLVLFHEGQTAKLSAGGLHSAAGWSPFTGRSLAAPPQVVIVGGRIVAEDGRIVSSEPAAPVVYHRP